MDNHYSADLDTNKRLITIKCCGFWDAQTLHSLLADVEPKEKRLAAAQKPYYVLINLGADIDSI
jgi:hypothetical protein